MASIPQASAAQFLTQLKYCKSLPTLPAVALQLIELAEDSTATLDEFAQRVSFDPALVGKLLRTANSSFYGFRRKVASLSEAIGLMGLNATISLSLSFSLRGLTSGQDGALDDTDYWSRSLLTALAARTIATELRERQPEDFLLAGLLQDIGVLAMASMLGDAYIALYKQGGGHAALLKQETRNYGFDHAQAGAQLLKYWRLPERFHECVLRSHAASQAGGEGGAGIAQLSACVAAAAHIADAWIQGATDASFNTAYRSVRQCLGISTGQYQNIIAKMRDEMPEMETLFESELLDPGILQGIQDSARELLALNNLRLSRASTEASVQIQALEQRIATLESQTRRDALTGLYNRAYLQHQLELEFDRAMREQSPLCLAYIDVDRFKSINDTFGHATGDQVLVTVAQRMLSAARQTDTVARYGGEEFIVLLPDTRLADARAVLESMLASVRDKPCLPGAAADSHVTFSAGIAALVPGAASFGNPAALLEAADDALYRTKSSGRGQITVHEPDEQ